MTTSDIIEELYLSPEVDRCILKSVPFNHIEDFKQELFIIIGSMRDEVIHRLYEAKQIRFYVAKIILNLTRNRRDVYHKKYLDHIKKKVVYDPATVERITDGHEYYSIHKSTIHRNLVDQIVSVQDDVTKRMQHEEREIRMLTEIENLDSTFNTPYFRMLIHTVNECGSMREASRQTGIDVSVISRSMAKIRKHLQSIP